MASRSNHRHHNSDRAVRRSASSGLPKPSGGTAILALTGNRRLASRAAFCAALMIADWVCLKRLEFPFPQIATGDLDVAVLGQLPPPNLPLSYEFEPSPVKVVGFDAAFRRWSLGEQHLKYAARNPHHALILAD